MISYSASTTINASPEIIWKLLVATVDWSSWDPGTDRIEGTVALGQRLKVYSKQSPGRAIPVRVTEFNPNRSMTWTGGMPLGLFKGVRTFVLTLQDDGSVRFDLREEFSGPLLPLIGKFLPDMTETFQNSVAGLKSAAEVT